MLIFSAFFYSFFSVELLILLLLLCFELNERERMHRPNRHQSRRRRRCRHRLCITTTNITKNYIKMTVRSWQDKRCTCVCTRRVCWCS